MERADLGWVAFDTAATRMQAHKFTERHKDFEDRVGIASVAGPVVSKC